MGVNKPRGNKVPVSDEVRVGGKVGRGAPTIATLTDVMKARETILRPRMETGARQFAGSNVSFLPITPNK